jgi:hypothetical protein
MLLKRSYENNEDGYVITIRMVTFYGGFVVT